MNLFDFKECDKCKKTYKTNAFENILANGECKYSTAEIYGEKYDLCPKCTYELYCFIKNGGAK